MATHDVKFKVPERSLGKADVRFAVWRNGEKFGTLTVSNGSVVWFPRDTSIGHKMSWPKFNDLVTENVRTGERRRR